jgi:hypothetical protein
MPSAALPALERPLPTWTRPRPLDAAHIDPEATGAGVIVLSHTTPEGSERVVWAEATDAVVGRLVDMLASPVDEPVLAWWLAHGGLRYQVALAEDATVRQRVARAMQAEARLGAGID